MVSQFKLALCNITINKKFLLMILINFKVDLIVRNKAKI